MLYTSSYSYHPLISNIHGIRLGDFATLLPGIVLKVVGVEVMLAQKRSPHSGEAKGTSFHFRTARAHRECKKFFLLILVLLSRMKAAPCEHGVQ